MDLCGPMRIASINEKRYVLVIVNDYSRYTWVLFLRSKDETPEVIKTFLKRITVLLQPHVIIIRIDNGIKFKNQVLKEYFDSVGISHQMSSVRTPQQNGVVERRNWTLVEAARRMLIFSRAPLLLWAEAIATACFTQNRSIIHRRFNKTPYELINGRKPDISFLYVFRVLCYPKNDREDIRKLGEKAMAFEQRSLKPGLQSMTSGQISSGLDLTYAPSTITTQQPTEGELDLLFEAMYDDYIGGQSSATARTVPGAQEPQDHPLEQVIGEPSRPVLTRNQLRSDGDMCMYALTFKRLDVWVLVPAPNNISPLTLKWLFKNKHDEEQTVIRNNSRLVVIGYRQEEGIDFKESFASSKYVLEILKKYGMESCDSVGTPIEIKDKLDLDQNGTPVDAMTYRSMIGALMYLTSSRPDIAHASYLCARYQAKPTKKHLKEVKRIFRYLWGTINTGLWYSKDFVFKLTGFSDAHYAGCKDTFKSTFGGA
nr:retrovirus-related Pol polyprotein from transposon TNT 1-94 [Tanacetum cinerariifolium]